MQSASRRYQPDQYSSTLALVRSREELPPYRVGGPKEIAEFIMRGTSVLSEAQEIVGVVLLDARHNVIGFTIVARGSINSCGISTREIFRPAMLANCAALVVFHNHPTGDPEPSGDDLRLTRRLVDAGNLLDVNVLDHLVIGDGSFVSIRAQSPATFDD